MKLPSLAKMRLVLYFFLYNRVMSAGQSVTIDFGLLGWRGSERSVIHSSWTSYKRPRRGDCRGTSCSSSENPAQNNNATSDNQQTASHVGTSSLRLAPQSVFAAGSFSFTANPTDVVVAGATVSPGSPANTVDGAAVSLESSGVTVAEAVRFSSQAHPVVPHRLKKFSLQEVYRSLPILLASPLTALLYYLAALQSLYKTPLLVSHPGYTQARDHYDPPLSPSRNNSKYDCNHYKL